jgi:hypothetical protein
MRDAVQHIKHDPGGGLESHTSTREHGDCRARSRPQGPSRPAVHDGKMVGKRPREMGMVWGRSGGSLSLTAPACQQESRPHSAARNVGYTFTRAASFAGKALALAHDRRQVLGPPRGPFREGRAAAPPRTLPRTVRSRTDCRLFCAPHSNARWLRGRANQPSCGYGTVESCIRRRPGARARLPQANGKTPALTIGRRSLCYCDFFCGGFGIFPSCRSFCMSA